MRTKFQPRPIETEELTEAELGAHLKKAIHEHSQNVVKLQKQLRIMTTHLALGDAVTARKLIPIARELAGQQQRIRNLVAEYTERCTNLANESFNISPPIQLSKKYLANT